MTQPQETRFWQVAIQSGLMDSDGLLACWNSIPPEKRDDAQQSDRRLARQAVQSKRLTLWQAQQLLAGRTNGFRIDRYVLLDLLGQGGMGRVYLAKDSRLDRRVAVKILAPDRVTNPRSVKRFEREAKVGAQLQHENLVRIYDSGQANGRLYLVMEYIEGKTIGTLIGQQGPMPPATAARLVRQTALGLEQMFRKGMIHRDVNPYNIMVTHDGTAKLADLGLAMRLDEDPPVTRDGATVGTFDYVSPEQARHSHAVDIRSDVYSLGCTLYHMIAGHVPFPGGSLPEKLYSHQTIEPQPLKEIVPDVPDGLVKIVARMMRKKAEDRYETPLQVAHALEPFAEDIPPSSIQPDPTPPVLSSNADEKSMQSAERPLDQAPTYVGNEPDPHSPPAEVRSVIPPANGAPEPTPASDQGLDQSPPSTPTGLETGMELPVLDPLPVTPASDPDQEPQWGLLVNTALPELKPRSTPKLATLSSPPKPDFADKYRKTVIVTLVAMAAVVSVIIGIQQWPANDPNATIKSPLPISGAKTSDASTKPKAAVHDRPDIEFAVVANGETVPYDVPPDGDRSRAFLDAAKRANGSDGRLLLGNTKPLELKADESIDFSSGVGQLTLNAAPEKRPVIVVEMTKRSKPVIRTGSSVRLNLLDITFIAKYSGDAGPVSTLIETGGGPVQIERCSFRVENPSEPRRLHAISADGGLLTVKHCWFQDFWSAIRFYAFPGSKGVIENSIIVSKPKAEGWAIELQSRGVASGGKDRQLRLSHDTIEGLGFLDLTEGENAPCLVEVDHCAVRTDAILAWKPTNTNNLQELPSDSLRWTGRNNLYEIHGPIWVWLKPRGERTPAFRLDITNPDEWRKRMSGEESLISAKLDFAKDRKPGLPPEAWQPKDFAIDSNLVDVTQTGADIKAVGPDDY